MKNNHTKQWLPAIMQILGCAVFMLALFVGAPDARAGIASDNSFLLDPFDPVPEIQFRHHGGYAWGNYGCGYNPCQRRHYNRCYRNCYGYSRCSRDCGGYRNECYGDRCNRHDGYRQGGYDGCRGDNCYRDRRHDGRDREIHIEKRLHRYDEQADRYDDQSDWYERRYMDRRHDRHDRWDDHDRYDR